MIVENFNDDNVSETQEIVLEANDPIMKFFAIEDIKKSDWRTKQRKKSEYINDAMTKVYNLFKDKKVDMKGSGETMIEKIKSTVGGDDGVSIITLFDLITSGYIKSGGVVDSSRPMTRKEIDWLEDGMSKEMLDNPSEAIAKMKKITLETTVRTDSKISPRLLTK